MLKESLCIGCGICAKACPFNAILIFEDGLRKIVFEPAKCGECKYECNNVCPTHAIDGKPDDATLLFEYAHCISCGKKLKYVLKEVEYLSKKLESMDVCLCDECKRKKVFDVATKYGGLL